MVLATKITRFLDPEVMAVMNERFLSMNKYGSRGRIPKYKCKILFILTGLIQGVENCLRLKSQFKGLYF